MRKGGGTRWPDRLWLRSRPYVLHPRVLLAFKTALAAAVAWFIAVRLPGVAADYPYYAPLGAVVSMYPTVAATAKQGLQTLIGLAIGIGLAFVGVRLGETDSLTIAFVVGLGVLLAGLLPRIGTGGEWIPMAGLFVLVIGGESPENYSTGYLLQMLVGVVVGLSVNILIFPPLHLNEAVVRIAGLRIALAEHFNQLSKALDQGWDGAEGHWDEQESALIRAKRGVRETVEYAESSRKANPRKRLHPRDLHRDYEHVDTLERVTFQVQGITTVLRESMSGSDKEAAVPPELAGPLQDAFAAIGELLHEWTLQENDDENLAAAREAVSVLRARLRESAQTQELAPAVASIEMSLQRILRVLIPQLNISSELEQR